MNAKNGAILVTGGAGYVGSHVVMALLDLDYTVVVVDDLTTGHRWAVDPRAAFIEGKIENESLVRSIMQMHKIQAVIHCAGSHGVAESVENPVKFYRNNTSASRSVIESAVACQVPHFIFASTASIYGISSQRQVSEGDDHHPINPFGMSKLMTERMLADISAAYPMNYCALRYFNIAGADSEMRCGQSTIGAPPLIKASVETVLGKRSHVAICGTDYDTPDGTGVRDYIHVSDLAAAHISALHMLMQNPSKSHAFNCGNGVGYSVLDVLDAVERVTGILIERRPAPRRAGDPDTLIADNRAILATLDWKPRFTDLDQIISDAYRWERSMPRLPLPTVTESSRYELA